MRGWGIYILFLTYTFRTIDVWNHRPRDGGGVRTVSPNEVIRNFLRHIVTLTYVTVIPT